ncbi:Cytochrome P460 [Nitrosospira sp. Nl5]|uniref:cytochrome P460 family protein n=1 Tax=Nitrosospira sp. Nl5 TaxID=200120 RepID=UPI00088F71E6|nr:cytochrome P460 family protein [Nitrosospira sp. Nl5]SCY08716.1 Cytochrome P460 [Nitrosospira sp. Nl5]
MKLRIGNATRYTYLFRNESATVSLTAVLFAMALLAHPGTAMADKADFSLYVDKSGNISLPDDFRLSMTHLGSWFVPEGEASGFHDVYTEPETVRAYRKTGIFPDGATLVKELRPSTASNYTTGTNVSHATGGVKQWFVMIKDTKARFADNPVWGDGWGWALIKTDSSNRNTTTNYRAECLSCHMPAKNTDWIYVEGYPTLSKPGR